VEENDKEFLVEVLAAVVVNLDTLRDAHLRLVEMVEELSLKCGENFRTIAEASEVLEINPKEPSHDC
jgi:hypothetical protein